MDNQAQAELRTATLLLSGFDGRLQHIDERLDRLARLVSEPTLCPLCPTVERLAERVSFLEQRCNPEPPRYQEPGIPGILEMVENAIRAAWAASDWGNLIGLCNQYRELRNTL